MAFGTGFAIYFIIWWLVLFVVLPFGHRSQEDERDIVPGTVESAPANFRFGRVVLRTTVVSAIVFAGYLLATIYGGYSLSDVTGLFPDFK